MNRLASGEISRIKFVVLVFIAILFTETAIAQTDVLFLKKNEGDYVGVPSSASVALLSARPGDTDRTQDPTAVDLRELERRTRQMVNARVQEEALLHVDAHLSAKEPVELRRLTAVESPGAAQPRGTIVYLHGSRAPGDAVDVLPIGYSAFAQRMRLDQFAVIRPQEYDTLNDDGRIIAFTVAGLRQLSEEGYRTIYLAGQSRGAWLAAVAATISGDISGLLISAPGNTTLDKEELAKQRGLLASLLSQTKAKRVFVALFEGDPREAVPGGRGSAVRDALVRANVPFWVLDQPADLVGHFAIASGRFVRRYADCLEDFFNEKRLATGPFRCQPTGRYSSGNEIRYPEVRPIHGNAADISPKLMPFLGRWEGDSSEGAYLILTSTGMGEDYVMFLQGYAPSPAGRSLPWIREFKFRLSADGNSLVHSYPSGQSFELRLLSRDEAIFEAQREDNPIPMRFLLRRRKQVE